MKKRDEITSVTKRSLLFAGAFTAALSSALMSGCTQTTEAPAASASAPAITAPPAEKEAAPVTPAGAVGSTGTTTPSGPAAAGAPAMAGGGNAPFASGMGGDPNAPLSPTPDMDKKIAAAEGGKDKKAISGAYTERGAARMYDAKAGARTKYRAALEDFRKALAADPTNKDAKASKDTIESIYKSMGRPIP